MQVFPSRTAEQTKEQLDAHEKEKATGRLYDRLFVRHWKTWEDGRRNHVFVMPADSGAPVDLMIDMDADCPSEPFGGAEEFTFTPDGRGIVFTARDAGDAEPWSTDFDLYSVPVDASAPPKCLTADNKAWDTTPVFSPDGGALAYLAMGRPAYEPDRVRIIMQEFPDGPQRVLAEDWDRSMPLWSGNNAMCFSRDGRTIYTSAPNLGQQSLFAIDVKTGKTRTLVEKGSAASPVVTDHGVIFTHNDYDSPAELYRAC